IEDMRAYVDRPAENLDVAKGIDRRDNLPGAYPEHATGDVGLRMRSEVGPRIVVDRSEILRKIKGYSLACCSIFREETVQPRWCSP
ncbi:hypothetical protein, partial [Geoalkalibacter sp.]|uniref:hypothetical protein n=1 Tax=Geoalkalibacter sp. TaxID=3041440 RepID=UPI00272E2B58